MGIFVTFEGVEGSGKSYQAKAFYNKLTKLAIPAVLTHEPGGTAAGERITRLLKWGKEANLSPLTELMLFNASRTQLITDIIKPGLENGNVVICDRFTDSTLAYQGYGRGLDPALIKQMNNIASQEIKPDVTILLDIPSEEGLARKDAAKPDRFHQENMAFHKKVRNGFLQLVAAEPERWVVIDGRLSKSIIASIIWEKVIDYLAS